MSAALSGIDAAGAQVDAAASNIVNLDTPGYHAQRPDLVDLSGNDDVTVAHIITSG